MKNILQIAVASMVALAMIAFPADSYSQARRSNTGRGTTTTQNNGSSSSRSSVSGSAASRRSSSGSSSASVSRSSSASTQSSSAAIRSSSSRSSGSYSQSASPSVRSRSQDNNTTRRGTTASQSRSTSSGRSSVSRGVSSRSSSTGRSDSSVSRSSASDGSVSHSSASRSSSIRVARPVDRNRRSSARDSYKRSSTSRSSSIRSSRSDVRESSQGIGNATRNGLTSDVARRGGTARETRSDFMRISEDRNVLRIPPRERDFLAYDRPNHFWGYHPHYYGYRVNYLPPRFRRLRYWDIDYCFYDGIYYRPYADWYVVCRPPFGITFALDLIESPFASVRFSYYGNTYRTFRAIDANNRLIDEQNRIIAQNNATLAAQNNAIALNSARANVAYSLADRLGLVQSYAYANQPYFYQDGVFYIVNSNNEYEVIVPPAGALVSELPDDYDTITLDGMDFYKVDDTVYRLTLVDGIPYLEVLGQMYGSLARQYNYYANGQKYNNLY